MQGAQLSRGSPSPARGLEQAGCLFCGTGGDGDSSAVPSLPHPPAPFTSSALWQAEAGGRSWQRVSPGGGAGRGTRGGRRAAWGGGRQELVGVTVGGAAGQWLGRGRQMGWGREGGGRLGWNKVRGRFCKNGSFLTRLTRLQHRGQAQPPLGPGGLWDLGVPHPPEGLQSTAGFSAPSPWCGASPAWPPPLGPTQCPPSTAQCQAAPASRGLRGWDPTWPGAMGGLPPTAGALGLRSHAGSRASCCSFSWVLLQLLSFHGFLQ